MSSVDPLSFIPSPDQPFLVVLENIPSFGHGKPTCFRPAGLPVPDWAIVINPCAPYAADEPWEENDLNRYFDPGNQDAHFILLEGPPNLIAQSLQQLAQKDSDEHVGCENGGAYVYWRVSEDKTLVGGLDNAGMGIALNSVNEILDLLNVVAPGQYKILATDGDGNFELSEKNALLNEVLIPLENRHKKPAASM